MRLPQQAEEWQKGFKKFIDHKFGGTLRGETAPCPCTRCRSMSYEIVNKVRSHLLHRGFSESFILGEGEEKDSFGGISERVDNEGGTGDRDSVKDMMESLIHGSIHGEIMGTESEEPNESAKTFFKLLIEAKGELYPGCKEATKIFSLSGYFRLSACRVLVTVH